MADEQQQQQQEQREQQVMQQEQKQLPLRKAPYKRHTTNPLYTPPRPRKKVPAGPVPAAGAAVGTPSAPGGLVVAEAAEQAAEDVSAREKRRIEEERQRHEDLYERVRLGQDEIERLTRENEGLKKEHVAHQITKNKYDDEKRSHVTTKKQLQQQKDLFKNFQGQITDLQKTIVNLRRQVEEAQRIRLEIEGERDEAKEKVGEQLVYISQLHGNLDHCKQEAKLATERADENEAAADTLQETVLTFKELFDDHSEGVGIEKYVAIVTDEHHRLKAHASQESLERISQNGQPKGQGARHMSSSLSDELAAKAFDTDPESSDIEDEIPEEPTLTKIPTPQPQLQNFGISMYPGVAQEPTSILELATSTVGTQTEVNNEVSQPFGITIYPGVAQAPSLPQVAETEVASTQTEGDDKAHQPFSISIYPGIAQAPISPQVPETKVGGTQTDRHANYKDASTQHFASVTQEDRRFGYGKAPYLIKMETEKQKREEESEAQTIAQNEREEAVKKLSIALYPSVSTEPAIKAADPKLAAEHKSTNTKPPTFYDVWTHQSLFYQLLSVILLLGSLGMLLSAWGERELWRAANDSTRRHVLGLMVGEGNSLIDMMLYGFGDITGLQTGSLC